jgi:hypothetical protein
MQPIELLDSKFVPILIQTLLNISHSFIFFFIYRDKMCKAEDAMMKNNAAGVVNS